MSKQKIEWTRIRDGVYWGIAPCGLAYEISREGKCDGVMHWALKEFPNEDAEIGEYVDVGPFGDLKRIAEGEATCAAINAAREVAP